ATFAFTVQLKHGSEKAQSFFDQDVNWKNVRILVIDDSVDILEYFREITHGYGVICDTAISGEEALRLVDQNGAYHIYFVDWKMPGMDSLELTKELKARSSEKSVVIMMSAADWNAIEEKAKKAGVDKFLSKPLFPSFIVDTMNEALGLDRQQIEKAQTDISGIFADHCILLAEDVEINREIVLALLEPSQMKIDCAENGAEAVQKFIESPGSYDMIFMDVQMPEMDGFEATRRIRALDIPNAKTIPIVAMTANVFKEDIDNSLNAGMNDHIGKPLDFNVLLKKLHKYLPEKSITGIV
ncbi:MAG: response regulator, partial [Treponema sp.]|nr:response regulator [Treponema sp.]